MCLRLLDEPPCPVQVPVPVWAHRPIEVALPAALRSADPEGVLVAVSAADKVSLDVDKVPAELASLRQHSHRPVTIYALFPLGRASQSQEPYHFFTAMSILLCHVDTRSLKIFESSRGGAGGRARGLVRSSGQTREVAIYRRTNVIPATCLLAGPAAPRESWRQGLLAFPSYPYRHRHRA